MSTARRAVHAVGRALGATVGRALVLLLTGLIRVYQLTVSPLMAPTCRFHPSCSRYAVESLRTHGAAKGTVLAAWRLLRCHPWNPGGLDPVPDRGAWRPAILPDGRPRPVDDPESDPIVRTA